MRILLANYTGDRANWGCQATSRNLLGFLKKSLSAESDLEIYTTPFPRGHAVDNLFDIVYGDRIKSIFTNPQPSLREPETGDGGSPGPTVPIPERCDAKAAEQKLTGA
jgi:hypothetical protein